MSIPIAATSPAKPIAATAAVSSCASDPTMPEGQTGAPDADLRMVAAGSPIRRSSDLAIRRAVPLCRRTLSTAAAKARASSGLSACSSPARMSLWPMKTGGAAIRSTRILSALTVLGSTAVPDNPHPVNVEVRVHPEGVVLEALEQLGRQHRGSLQKTNLAAHRMQAGRAQSGVELFGAVFDIVEVVHERGLAHEVVELGHRAGGVAGERLIGDQDHPVGPAAVKRLAQAIEGKAHHSVAGRQTVHPRVDRAARL